MTAPDVLKLANGVEVSEGGSGGAVLGVPGAVDTIYIPAADRTKVAARLLGIRVACRECGGDYEQPVDRGGNVYCVKCRVREDGPTYLSCMTSDDRHRLGVDRDAARAESAEQKLERERDFAKRAYDGLDAERNRLAAELATAKAALTKIDAVRNSIVGRQGANWSMHIYPLVAALKEAGYSGEGYDVARSKAEAEVAALNAEFDALRAKNAALAGRVTALEAALRAIDAHYGPAADCAKWARAALKPVTP